MEIQFYDEINSNSSLFGNSLKQNPFDNCHRLLLQEEINSDQEYDTLLINKAVYENLGDQLSEFYLKWFIPNKNKKPFLREMYVSKALEAVVLIYNEPVSRKFMEQFVVRIVHSEGLSSTEVINNTLDGYTVNKERQDQNEEIDNCSLINKFNYAHRNCNVKKSTNPFHGNSKDIRSIIPCLKYVPAMPGECSVVWLVSFANFDISYCFSVEICSTLNSSFVWQCDLHRSKQESLIHMDTDIHRILYDNISRSVSISTLMNDLSFVRNLLSMDPRNKCSLIAIVSLLRIISPLESREEIIDILIHQLPSLDSVNSCFYFEAASKFILECHLISLHNSHLRHVSLASQGLTTLSYLSWMTLMTDIDLSNNQLSFLPDTFSNYLLCLNKLNLSNNQIVSLLSLKGLRTLSNLNVSHNIISKFQDLEPVLFCTKLVYLNIKGNLVSQLPNLTNLITDHPTSRLHIDSLSIIYDKNL